MGTDVIRFTQSGRSLLIEADDDGLSRLADAVEVAQAGNAMVIGDPGETLTIQRDGFEPKE